MQNLTDHTSVEKYSEEFSNIILNNFFNNKEYISGHEILELTPVRQVNLFIIKSLLFQWKKETEKLKSDFFDFNHEDVQKALSTFMNTVSRHISVNRENMAPLLKEATEDSILLIFFPYVYYTNLFKNWNEDEIRLKDLRQINKYIKINGSLMNTFILQMETGNQTSVDKEQALNLLNDIVEHSDLSPADTESFEQQYNQVLSFHLNAFVQQDEVDEKERVQQAEPDTEPKVEEEIKQPVNHIEEERTTVNDGLQEKERTTLADIHQRQKIERISKYISINQKFMFINQLFDKDWGKFEKAISFLDETNDKHEIVQYLDNNAPAWREESDEAEEFRIILEKKLGQPITDS